MPFADTDTPARTCRSEESNGSSEVDFAGRMRFFDEVLEQWLASPDVTVACGSWGDGAIAELMPRGQAELLPPAYSGCFEGVRELRLPGSDHHLHVDLGRVHRVVYSVAPSVCFGGKPSYEARFLTTGAGGAPTSRWMLSCMLTAPYERGELVVDQVRWFLARALADLRQRPDVVRFEVDESVVGNPVGEVLRGEVARAVGEPSRANWSHLLDIVQPPHESASLPVAPSSPPVLALLEDALALPDASLVIYRDRVLVELQTERIDGVHRYVEDGHVSWQVGATHDHHCHLAFGAVTSVEFTAEAVPCQGGRPNYTAWFLVPGRCGNPYRVDGYFSVVLNRPYRGGEECLDVIEPMLDLYRRYAPLPWVSANQEFIDRVQRSTVGGGGDAASES